MFMLEGCLISSQMLQYRPSIVAASALYLASKLCFSKEPWSNRMAQITTLQEKTLRKCAKDIYEWVLLRNCDESNKLRAVFNKYSSSKYGSVSLKILQRTQQKESVASAAHGSSMRQKDSTSSKTKE